MTEFGRYIYSPVYVEAFLYDGDLIGSDGGYYCPKWAEDAFKSGVLFYKPTEDSPSGLFIDNNGTFLGYVRVGDYVLRWKDGRFFSLSPEEFLKDFVKVE